MPETELFSILDSIDSTNNYAMAKVHEGMAKHGMAWFARDQTAGKGQRGKVWESHAGQNVALSIVLQPKSIFYSNAFLLNALVAVSCQQFFSRMAGQEIYIKWPNDIYWRDRKAGGILIENVFSDKKWKWSVVGIGLNINQKKFNGALTHVTSLALITGKEWDPETIAQNLHKAILQNLEAITENDFRKLLEDYNTALYKREETVRLKKDNVTFSTIIKKINDFGQLITEDAMERQFNFGEVEWVR